MSKVAKLHGGIEDYNIACSKRELEALRAAVKDADGRKGEVQLAKDVLGIN